VRTLLLRALTDTDNTTDVYYCDNTSGAFKPGALTGIVNGARCAPYTLFGCFSMTRTRTVGCGESANRIVRVIRPPLILETCLAACVNHLTTLGTSPPLVGYGAHKTQLESNPPIMRT
jgi:hypothetical protein